MSSVSFDSSDFSSNFDFCFSPGFYGRNITPSDSYVPHMYYANSCSPPSSPESIHIKPDPDMPMSCYEPQSTVHDTPHLRDMLPAFNNFFGQERLGQLERSDLRSPQSEIITSARDLNARTAPLSVAAPIWTPPAITSTIDLEPENTPPSVTSTIDLENSPPATTSYLELGDTRPAITSNSDLDETTEAVPDSPGSKKRKRCDSDDSEGQKYYKLRSDQRLAANLKERRRTKRLNDAFVTLRKFIPMAYADKASKYQTVKMAASYIAFLHEVQRAVALEHVKDSKKNLKTGVKTAMLTIRESPNAFESLKTDVLTYAFNLWLMEVKLEEGRFSDSSETSLLQQILQEMQPAHTNSGSQFSRSSEKRSTSSRTTRSRSSKAAPDVYDFEDDDDF